MRTDEVVVQDGTEPAHEVTTTSTGPVLRLRQQGTGTALEIVDGQDAVKWSVSKDGFSPGGSAAAIAANQERWQSLYGGVRYSKPVVALRFDDDAAAGYTTVYPLLTARALPAAFAVFRSAIGGAGSMTLAQIQEMQKFGMEIMCHSRSHGADPASLAAFIDETETVASEMRTLDKLLCASYVQPGTWVANYNFDTAAKADGTHAGDVMRRNFASFQGYIGDELNNTGTRALPSGRRYGRIGHTSPTTLAAAQNSIRQVAGGHAAMLLFHPASLGTGGQLTVAELTTLLDEIVTMRDAGQIEVLTPTGMLYAQPGSAVNLAADPGFEISATGAFRFWVPTGAPTVAADGRTGNAVHVDSSNYVRQYLTGLATGVFTGYAKASAGTLTARVILRSLDGSGNTLHDAQVTASVTSAGWTKISTPFGAHIDARSVEVWLYVSGAGTILWDDITITKV